MSTTLLTHVPQFTSTNPTQDLTSMFFDALHLQVAEYKKQTIARSIYPKEHISVYYRLIYCLKGEGTITHAQQTHHLRPGQVMILQPFMQYSLMQNSQEAEIFYMEFEIGTHSLRSPFQSLFADKVFTLHSPNDDSQVFFLYQWLSGSIHSGYGAKLILSIFLLKIIDKEGLFDALDSTWIDQHALELHLIEQSTLYLQNNLMQPIRVKEIAAALGVSESKLYKTYQEFFNISPSRYFMQMKVAKAQQMLLSSDDTVGQIAESLGFSSAFHLSKAYKDVLGFSPSDSRKKQRDGHLKSKYK